MTPVHSDSENSPSDGGVLFSTDILLDWKESKRRIKMDKKKFGYFAFGGLLLGAVFGLMWSAGNNPFMGISIGALIGLAIGWFAAAAMLQQNKK
jgi:hypothetical protein